MGNDASTASRQHILHDLKSRTNFSSKEIQRLYQRFRKDCRKNGHQHKLEMNLDEFTTILRHTFEEAIILDGDESDLSSEDDVSFADTEDQDFDKFAEHAFRSFDMDRDGKVDFAEYILALDAQMQSCFRSKVENLFRVYDIDGDNLIEREEAREIIQVLHALNLGCLPKEDVITPELLTNVIFKRADANGDDVICKKEFVRAAMHSTTLRAVLEGTSYAFSQPFVCRAGVESRSILVRASS